MEHFIVDIFDIHFLELLSFLQKELNKSLFLIAISPQIGDSFPKNIKIWINILSIIVILNNVHNIVYFFPHDADVIVTNHNQNEILDNPELVLDSFGEMFFLVLDEGGELGHVEALQTVLGQGEGQ